LCGGKLDQRPVTKLQTWKGELVSIVENVPAWVCNQCGERYYDGPVLDQIEEIMRTAETPPKSISVPAYKFFQSRAA
jgi:YgiT-type zinc finger domain-containing protein